MAFRLGLVLLVVVCVIALGWLLGAEDEPGPSLPVGTEAAVGRDEPSLTTVRRPESPRPEPPPAQAARPLPDWLRGKPIAGEVRARLSAWIQADPRNVDDFITDIMRRTSRFGAHTVFQGARYKFTIFRDIAPKIEPVLRERLRMPVPVHRRAALLGALYGLTWGRGSGVQRDLHELERLLLSSDKPLFDRTLAARTLLIQIPLSRHYIEPLRSLLRETADPPSADLLLLLHRLKTLRERAKPFVPTLLALRPQLENVDGADELILAIVAQADPTIPEARSLFIHGLGHPSATVRALALVALAEGDARDLAGALESATSAAKVEGAKLLLRKGVARERVAGLLLAALARGGYQVREQAITLLPRVTPDVRDALPVIEDLLKGDDTGRWLSGTKALGALTTSAGARDDIMHLLFTAARLPDARVRVTAVQSLLMFDDHAAKVIPVLADLLKDTEADVRREAVDGLGELSAHHPAAKPHLQAALGDADESVRKLAKYWLSLDDD